MRAILDCFIRLIESRGMATTDNEMNDLDLSESDRFEIGGKSIFSSIPAEKGIADMRIRVSTLLKTETVSFLLGAGASVVCGGPLIGKIPLHLEKSLHTVDALNNHNQSVSSWLRLFYAATNLLANSGKIAFCDQEILTRRTELEEQSPSPLPVNLEQLLALLYRWKMALTPEGTRLHIDRHPQVKVTVKDLDCCLFHMKQELASLCNLPTDSRKDNLKYFQVFLRKILTRPLTLKRINLFTLNYDTLIEQAADAEGVVLLDGFRGTQKRIFRPESYEQDLYFPGEVTDGRVRKFERVVRLYKLHGSVTWVASEPVADNPYGVSCQGGHPESAEQMLVYPVPTKITDTLGMPYAELFRRFASTVVQPQSVLFVVGYGFGDDHVNAIIRQALSVPSFTLVIVDPEPKNEFVSVLSNQDDQRIWVFRGETLGRFEGFVGNVLPDLQDESTLKKVMDTHRALSDSKSLTERISNDG